MVLSHEAHRTLTALRTSLPEGEWRAVKAWLGTFYPYQLEWLLDYGRFSLTVKSRQIGASHTYAAAAILWALFGETTTIVSVGEREAAEVVDKANKHARALYELGARWLRFNGKNATTVKFYTDGRVLALPASSAGRGYSGNVLLDEFAYHDRPEEVWDGAGGTVMHGGKLRVLSTPNGVGNLFHRLWIDPAARDGYRQFAVTIDDAIEQGLKVNLDECWRMAHGDGRVFDSLFRCKFTDGDAQYIPSDLINGALADDTYCYEGDCYAGLDIGRTVDRTVLVVLRVDADGIAWEQRMVTAKRTSQVDINVMVKEAFGDFPIRRLCVDATGMGAFPAEALQKDYGKFRVEPVTFTQGSKEDLATTVYQRLSDKKVRIRRDNQVLRDDLCAIRRIITSAGNVRYDAPHTELGHADSAWAFALALHATVQPSKRKHVDGGAVQAAADVW